MGVAEILVWLLGIYTAAGVLFAAWFVSSGIQRMDEAAAGADIAFRLLMFPGVAALWPYLLSRWMKGHRRA
jgi:uncharacterized membrane protein YecN with MAPEG domain